MNAAAAVASSEHLLFLHADCRPGPGFVTSINQALRDPSVSAGCFRQRIDHPAPRYRIIERGNALRVRLLRWMYGDQGLFLRRETFEQAGRFPELPLMEDLYFSKRLSQQGRLVVLPDLLTVSPRRWERRGVVRQTIQNWSLILRAHAGVPLATLAAEYSPIRDAGSTASRQPGEAADPATGTPAPTGDPSVS